MNFNKTMKNNSSILIIFGLIICGFFASCGSESDPGLKTALDNGHITEDINEADGFTPPQGSLLINDGEVATKKRQKLIVNGNDYNTKDGTAVRDFIHVTDLAEMHMLAATHLVKKPETEIYNCGYGIGYSVQDIVYAMNKILDKKINFEYGPRRKGDAEYSVANNEKFVKRFNWRPKYNNLEDILKTALNWERNI